MPDQVKILTARRAYEFRPDDLRLTLLSTPPILERIQQAFNFQSASIGTPPPTFGDVPPTLPPGLIFTLGVWSASTATLVPIRFLHVEPRRIVIDVAGPSSALDPVFAHLGTILADMRAPDGSPVIGEPYQVLDYSEITARFPLPPEAMVAPTLRSIFAKALGVDARGRKALVAPMLHMQLLPIGAEFPGALLNNNRTLQFALRAGRRPEEQVYFSGAPLGTDAHLAYLQELETALLALQL